MNDIKIDYLLSTDNSWKSTVVSPDYYFDYDDSGYSINSIEKHQLEPREYIAEQRDKIVFLNFNVSDSIGNKRLTRFTYWEGGKNQIKDHQEYLHDELVYRTIIQWISLTQDETLLLRHEEINGQLIPISHSILNNEEEFIWKADLTIFEKLRK